jgi:hypothetical protein
MAGYFTQAELEEIWRRSMDSDYTEPLESEDDGRGFDVIAGVAKLWEYVSLSIDVSTQAMYVSHHSDQTQPPASGAIQAAGTVTLDRTFPKYGDIELEAGDVLEMSHVGTKGETIVIAELELSNDVSLPESLPAPVTATVNAIRAGYQANGGPRRTITFSQRVTAEINDVTVLGNTLTHSGTGNTFTEDMVGAFVRFLAGSLNVTTYPRRILSVTSTQVVVDGTALLAETADIEVVDINELGVTAELTTELSNGTHPWLDALGLDRLIARNPNEIDASYRARVKTLPDTISPNAMIRAISRIFRPSSTPYQFLESRNVSDIRGFFADADPADDPDAYFPGGNGKLLLGNTFEFRGFFVVVEYQPTGDPGQPADTTPASSGSQMNAADLMPADGEPFIFYQDMADMIKEVEKTRMAGVPWGWAIVNSL